eukprot:TRINITY_DN111972_c0_g1_i1.p2 TRINITY_DN111972_c0_g1~~TRINITY_DN111972_c0_g1_i1.p2  ORF type:complete len:125 (-),score=18.23 TRINITY_DN111972_c0_g1_i1:72-446(-)
MATRPSAFVFGRPSPRGQTGRCPICTLPWPCVKHAAESIMHVRKGTSRAESTLTRIGKSPARQRPSRQAADAAAHLDTGAEEPEGDLDELDRIFDGMADRVQKAIVAMREQSDAALMRVARANR